ncbi:hypothetical protein GOP47_0009298 [Adiantum capillus-veneris]|uniref:Uncharacterized protein n=1 Tax=Adiantum capillus-veneris TaxID=13818 RepID=A0A9D4UXI9_ADICA|nr:hypothetical protein GOP47_0009298 [Adiantum capillus-veneris]
MLQAGTCRRGSRIVRALLVCSEARKAEGDHERTSRARSFLGLQDGRSCISKPTPFQTIMAASLGYLGTHSKLGTHTSSFRCFHVHGLDQIALAKPDALGTSHPKSPHETAHSKANGKPFGEAQDACSKTEEALQAFNDIVNKLKASDKDADPKTLQTLETLLAQAESSATLEEKQRIGEACATLAEWHKEPAKSLLYAQKGFEILRRIKDIIAKFTACRCLYAIAAAHCNTGEFEKALKQAEHLALILRHLEKTARSYYLIYLKFASQAVLIKCKMSLGRAEEALAHFVKYVKLKERLVARDDPSLAAVYIQAAEAFQEAGQNAEAVHYALQGLNILAEKFGPSSYQVGYVRALLSQAYYWLGLYEDCLSEYDKARPILETVGENSIENMAPFIMKSVLSLIELQRYELAITRLEELRRRAPKTSVAHAASFCILAKVYALSDKKKEFFQCSNTALEVLESNLKFSVTTGEYICLLASTYEMQKYYEEAIMLYKKALAIFIQFSGDEAALKAADAEGEIGIAFLRWGKFSQAAVYLKNYTLKNKSLMGSDNTRLIAVHNRIGAEYLQVGKLNEALEQLEIAKHLLPSDLTEFDDAIVLSLHQNLATLYKATGRLEDAINCQKTALDKATNSNQEEIASLKEEIQKSLDNLLQTQAETTGKCEL